MQINGLNVYKPFTNRLQNTKKCLHPASLTASPGMPGWAPFKRISREVAAPRAISEGIL
jgi:hypothetical protein